LLILENLLYDEEQKQFLQTKMWEVLLTNEQKRKENRKIPLVDVIGGRFKVQAEPHFKLVVLSAIKAN